MPADAFGTNLDIAMADLIRGEINGSTENTFPKNPKSKG